MGESPEVEAHGMFKVVADVARNRLCITLGGHLTTAEVKQVVETIFVEVGKLRPGFDLINNIADALPTDEYGTKELMRMQRHLMSLGMRRVIRVTRILLTELQFERISKQAGYHSIVVSSVEKAERLLDSCVIPEDSTAKRNWDKVRKYRRVSVGPDHTVQFVLGSLELTNVRITNLSAEGCFAVVQEEYGNLLRENTHLGNFQFEHVDLPSTKITAKVVRVLRGLSEIGENDIGLGIQFLTSSQQFTEWVDAYVMAYYGLKNGPT